MFYFPGINVFLDGFIPTENLRFRKEKLMFKVAETADKVHTLRFARQNCMLTPAACNFTRWTARILC